MPRATYAMTDDRRYFVALDPNTDQVNSASLLWSAYAWSWDSEAHAFALRWVWSVDDTGQDAAEVLDMLKAWADEYAGTF